MIATNECNSEMITMATTSSGTYSATTDGEFIREVVAECILWADVGDRNAENYRHRIAQMAILGARINRVGGSQVLWWPVCCVPGLRGPQRLRTPPIVVLAGFMSQSRGLSWDRRSRKGIK